VLLDSTPIGVILNIDAPGGIIMETKKFSVPNISCGHCVMTIQRELKEVEGVKKVEGDPKTKEITVEWENPATLEEIKSTLEEINYPAAD
jgi:copper chaperone CopZ